jgi:hypothetical protein
MQQTLLAPFLFSRAREPRFTRLQMLSHLAFRELLLAKTADTL